MRLAQRLYEGIELDGETTGLITYMRTDGIDLAQEAITQAPLVLKLSPACARSSRRRTRTS